MEKIHGKYDDLTQKIRPGSTWVAGFTQPGNNDDLRSIDSDGAEMRIIPSSRYYAGCTIKRGQAVSIAQLSDLTVEQKQNKYAYVKITDPDIDETCIGIAMNYAEEGQIVQIQNTGKFNYNTTESILYTEAAAKREIFLNAKDWSFENVRGQKLYIKKLYNNLTTGGEDTRNIDPDEHGDNYDTDHPDHSYGADSTDWFTYKFEDSINNVKNTIQIGTLTDAPTTNAHYYFKDEEGWKQKLSDGTVVPVHRDAVVVVYDEESKSIVTAEEIKLSLTGVVIPQGARPPKAHEAVWLQKAETIDGVDYYSAVDDLTVTIELDITGDTRGPIDNTQFILTVGESMYFETKKQDVELKAPDFYQGIYDELKVVALAEGDPSGPCLRFFLTAHGDVAEAEAEHLDYAFISVRKLDGDTCIIPIMKAFTLNDLANGAALIDANDEGYFRLSREFTLGVAKNYFTPAEKFSAGTEYYKYDEELQEFALVETPKTSEIDSYFTKTQKSPKITIADPVTSITRDSLKEAIEKALKSIFIDNDTGSTKCTTHTYNIGDEGFQIVTDETSGYYDVYVSSNLLHLITATAVKHGQSAKAGTAILADIRDASRLNVVGIVLSNETGMRKVGETIKVLKMGRITTLGNLQTGKEYFLGLNGRITADPMYWYDNHVPVGIAESANCFVADVSLHPLKSYSGCLPLGYVKPSIYGMTEKGYILADGKTRYNKDEYPELYKFLLNCFSEEELKPSNVSEDQYNKYTKWTLQKVFTDLFGQMAEMQLQYNDFNEKKEAIESKLDELQTDFESTKAAQEVVDSTQTQNIQSNQTKIGAMQTEIAENQSSQSSIDETQTASLQEAQEKITSLQGVVETLQTTNETLQGNVTSLQTALEAQQSANETLQSNITDLQSKNTSLETTNADLLASITALQDAVKELQDKVTTLESKNENEPTEEDPNTTPEVDENSEG